jgi:hypothetical protein
VLNAEGKTIVGESGSDDDGVRGYEEDEDDEVESFLATPPSGFNDFDVELDEELVSIVISGGVAGTLATLFLLVIVSQVEVDDDAILVGNGGTGGGVAGVAIMSSTLPLRFSFALDIDGSDTTGWNECGLIVVVAAAAMSLMLASGPPNLVRLLLLVTGRDISPSPRPLMSFFLAARQASEKTSASLRSTAILCESLVPNTTHSLIPPVEEELPFAVVTTEAYSRLAALSGSMGIELTVVSSNGSRTGLEATLSMRSRLALVIVSASLSVHTTCSAAQVAANSKTWLPCTNRKECARRAIRSFMSAYLVGGAQ